MHEGSVHRGMMFTFAGHLGHTAENERSASPDSRSRTQILDLEVAELEEEQRGGGPRQGAADGAGRSQSAAGLTAAPGDAGFRDIAGIRGGGAAITSKPLQPPPQPPGAPVEFGGAALPGQLREAVLETVHEDDRETREEGVLPSAMAPAAFARDGSAAGGQGDHAAEGGEAPSAHGAFPRVSSAPMLGEAAHHSPFSGLPAFESSLGEADLSIRAHDTLQAMGASGSTAGQLSRRLTERQSLPERSGPSGQGGVGPKDKAAAGARRPRPPQVRMSPAYAIGAGSLSSSPSAGVPGGRRSAGPGSAASSGATPYSRPETEELLVEYRIRLLSGFKRFFHEQTLEGVLSPGGMRLLCHCCDEAMHQPGLPLDLWGTAEREVVGRGTVQWQASGRGGQAWAHLALRRVLQGALRWDGWLPAPLRALALRPLKFAAELLSGSLSRVMLVGLEVAVELAAALSDSSPQLQWLRYAGPAGATIWSEVGQQAEAVRRFILDRVIEAPDRFQAIQSHRAALALLRQQVAFVRSMHKTGLVDGDEAEALAEPIERRIWRLEARGPRWTQPSLSQVLASCAMLRGVPSGGLEWLRASGDLRPFARGADLTHLIASGGIFIVVLGTVRVTLVPLPSDSPSAPSAAAAPVAPAASGPLTASSAAGQTGADTEAMPPAPPAAAPPQFYVGVGGVVGVSTALVGRAVPGMAVASAVAEGNSLGKGPVVFALSPAAVQYLRARAAAGQPDFALLMLNMYRSKATTSLRRKQKAVLDEVYDAPAAGLLVRTPSRPVGHLATTNTGGGVDADGRSSSSDSASVFAEEDEDEDDLEGSWGGADASCSEDTSSSQGHSTRAVAAALAADELLSRRCLERAAEIVEAVRQGIKAASLLTLQPGQVLVQRSTLVLVNGSLLQHQPHQQPMQAGRQDSHASGEGGAPSRPASAANGGDVGGGSGTGGAARAVRQLSFPVIKPPTLLLWLPDHCEPAVARIFKQCDSMSYTAGALGATVIVCGGEADETSPYK
ncbi:hypothetical protein GPECTOR_17g1003 [Gonium pectorale]|uniref:Cyclic nucleotide-binding domain-containing protein n=1 Tax=Gonium pectorale TaxID=33097 RepID=A0A150GLE3_GONPE|nr:hypothetical protein GPECTOR_17g1003 [Gonium pectorale]|eukprot:KXZ50130.1 hypothetical protein GPECTOR_17g1003 [Gonium pectorale]